MKKTKLKLEYELKTTSLSILWNSIGTPIGLAEWFADGVTVKDEEYTFTWEKYQQTARLIHTKPNSSIRFQWEEDEDTEYYFELKITSLELTEDIALVITDFADPSEKDDLVLLWNQQVEVLRRKLGV